MNTIGRFVKFTFSNINKSYCDSHSVLFGIAELEQNMSIEVFEFLIIKFRFPAIFNRLFAGENLIIPVFC